MNRAKALVEFAWPLLALAAVVFLSSTFKQVRPALVASKVTEGNQTRQDGWLFANTTSSLDASVEVTQWREGMPGKTAAKNLTATTVTTYTVFGTY